MMKDELEILFNLISKYTYIDRNKEEIKEDLLHFISVVKYKSYIKTVREVKTNFSRVIDDLLTIKHTVDESETTEFETTESETTESETTESEEERFMY